MIVKNKLLGAILIIAGTSIGGGMLAIPLVSSSLGILVSTLLLILIWLLGYYTSVLALKTNVFYSGAFSVSELCKKTFQSKIWLVSDLSIVILFYSLLAAYISGILEISLVRNLFPASISQYIGSLTVVALILFVVCNFKLFDLSNRVVFLIKTGFFATTYFVNAPNERYEHCKF